MLRHCNMIPEDDGGKIAINPDRFDKLITSLRTAVDNDGVLDKEATSYNDIFDAFRLALRFYHLPLGKLVVRRLKPRTHSSLSYQVPFRRRPAQVSRSASQRSARRPGMKQYSPPRLTTKAGSPLRWRRIGCFGMVNSRPSISLTSGSFSAGAPMNLPSFAHSLWTNSNCRSRCAPTNANRRPRSAPSSSRTPGGNGGP